MSDFSIGATDIGTGIAGFLNPIIGGTIKETVTTTPTGSSDKTILIVVAIVVVLVAGYFLLKPKKA